MLFIFCNTLKILKALLKHNLIINIFLYLIKPKNEIIKFSNIYKILNNKMNFF